MWTQFKTRLLQLFKRETIENEPKIDEQGRSVFQKSISQTERNEITQNSGTDEQANRSFRFPLIPDDHFESMPQNDPIDHLSSTNRSQKNMRHNRAVFHAPKRPIKSKSPHVQFTPSRVASPIYGYNTRADTKEIEKVPTFMRNKHTILNDELKNRHLNKNSKDRQEFSQQKSNEQGRRLNNKQKHHQPLNQQQNNHNQNSLSKNEQQQNLTNKAKSKNAYQRQDSNKRNDLSHSSQQQASEQGQQLPQNSQQQPSGKHQKLVGNDQRPITGKRTKPKHLDQFNKKSQYSEPALADLQKTDHHLSHNSNKGSLNNRQQTAQDDERMLNDKSESIVKSATTDIRNKDTLTKNTDKTLNQTDIKTNALAQTKTNKTGKNRSQRRQEKRKKSKQRYSNGSESRKKQTDKQAKTSTSRQKKSTVPFNVLMTPTDRKKMQEQPLRARKTQTPERQEKKSTQTKTTQPKSTQTNNNKYTVPYNLLNDPEPKSTEDDQWVIEQIETLERTLKHFNVDAEVVHATQGPTVTRFEVKPAIGVKVSRVRNLSDDIKMNMAAKDIRIEAPIPGKNTIGIEIPNLHPQMVSLQEILQTEQFQENNNRLSIGLGLDVEGDPVITTISQMPHGLIAGATGSGKSVCINTLLLSLIYKESYADLKLLLIDPKMVELAPYNGIPHLVSPVITDVKAATAALKWAVNEMEERYHKFVHESVRDISRYNEKMVQQGKQNEKLPYVVIVIDELADLMMVSPQDVEDAICRIAQKARAAGMHLVIATQRPSVDVITGLIKANIPTRIAFSVSSQVDSRTILDTNGAERLLGKGDMLFVENGSGKAVRLQGAFVSDDEIDRVTSYLRNLAPANYLFEQEELLKQIEIDETEDELFFDALSLIIEQDQASTSMLQRHFRIGYNRAARLIDSLEAKGIISGPKGSKPRRILMNDEQLAEIYNG